MYECETSGEILTDETDRKSVVSRVRLVREVKPEQVGYFTSGTHTVTGKQEARADGSSVVAAYGSSVVTADGSSVVTAYGSSVIRIHYGSPEVTLREKAVCIDYRVSPPKITTGW